VSKCITIDPVTRLEGHGKIDIFLDDAGEVERTLFQVPEFRGFEKFCEGRAAEEMPTLTQKICGVCPTAHHVASSKALDDLFGVSPPPTARLIRELLFHAFIFEDHILHFFVMSGPDFLVGPEAPRKDRNILGVMRVVGEETVRKIVAMRKRVRDAMAVIGGSPLHPVIGLPGGVSKGLNEEERSVLRETAVEAVEFARFGLRLFNDIVLGNETYAALMSDDAYRIDTYSMGLVDGNNRVSFYDGMLRVVDPAGGEFARFEGRDYLDHLEERVEQWSYLKPLYLKKIGWKGFADGADSGVYRVGPLGRLNAAEGMATPLAQAEYERLFDYFGGRPVHNTLAFHWARLVEVMQAAERMVELAGAEELTGGEIRTIPDAVPEEGIGVCEAPRGTLIHHYRTDGEGIMERVNLIVGTQNNAAALCLSIRNAAGALIRGGRVTDGLLNMVEMAFRAYDPCLACATHSLPGSVPLAVSIYDVHGNLVDQNRNQ
jgi:F420-non-reducing hydrogenase large subunit